MNLWTHHIKPEEPKVSRKKTKKKIYKQASAHHSVISAGEISLGRKRLQESEGYVSSHITEILRDVPPAVITATARNVTGDLSSYLDANYELKRDSNDREE